MTMPEPTPRPPLRWNVCPDCLGRHESGAACLGEQPTGGKTEQCGASSRIGFHYLVPYIGPCVLRHDHDGPVHEDANGTQWTDPRPAKAGDLAVLCPEQPPTGDLSERLDAALRTVGLARNLAAYRDAVLPVIEEALAEHMDERGAEQIERIQAERHALPKDERVRLDAADAPMLRIQLAVMARRVAETKAELERTSTAAALEIWHKLGMDASLHWKERAENAEDRLRKAEQAYMQLAEHHTDIKEHVAATQSRFAQIEKLIAAAQQRADQADAALQRVQDALAPSPEGAAFAIHTGGAGETTVQVVVPRAALRAALDADQPKETR